MELFVDMAEDTTRRPYMQVEVIPDTSTIAPGGTVGITPKLRFESGRVAEFPSWQFFFVEILEGDTLGTLIEDIEEAQDPGPSDLDSDTGDQILAGLGFDFIADTAAVSPSSARIRVTTEVYIPGLIIGEAPPGSKNGNTIAPQASSSMPSRFGGVPIEGTGQVVVKAPDTCEQPGEILLGETKYFYAKASDNDLQSLLVCELEADGLTPGKVPEDAVENPFGDDPIEAVAGGKSGVYWEQKWPEIDSDGSVTMHSLSDKLIRLVGRYWEAAKTYKVKLNASDGSRSGELEITVVEPDKLGEDYGKAKDVFDNEYNVDSLLVVYGGRYGVPPQWLKGQADIESVKTPKFQLSTGDKKGFHPAYRYEPFNWEFYIRTKRDKNGNKFSESPFWVTETSMGENDPPDHKHTRYQSYYTTPPTTVWDIVKEYSDLVEDKTLRLYARKDGNEVNFIDFGYKDLQKVYDRIVDYYKIDLKGDSLYLATRDSMAAFLKNEWKGPEERQPLNFEGGLENLYAQTRLASSYGLLQAWYVVATERGYAINSENKPENLNDNDVSFPIYMKHHIRNLKNIAGENNIEANNWDGGFEKVLKELMQKWNPYKGIYDDNVAASQKKFKPLNE